MGIFKAEIRLEKPFVFLKCGQALLMVISFLVTASLTFKCCISCFFHQHNTPRESEAFFGPKQLIWVA
jgi:hypothetical protein